MLAAFETMLKNLQLGKKFTILLLIVFLGGTILSGIALSKLLNYNAQTEISDNAYKLIETLTGVRDYTEDQIGPELSDKLETEFLPQVVPAYAAREVFERLREKNEYKEFFYKEAALNPTNLRDKADDFEAATIKRFRQNGNLKEATGFRSFPSGNLFYIARPIRAFPASCLQCHTTPDIAPKTMIERYGTEHGFNWPLNQIIGVQMISVPASQVLEKARRSLIYIMVIVVSVFAIVILMVNFWLKQYVVRPLNRMTHAAEVVSTGETDAEFESTSNDEVGRLAAAFTRMKTSLAIARRKLEKYRSDRRSKDLS